MDGLPWAVQFWLEIKPLELQDKIRVWGGHLHWVGPTYAKKKGAAQAMNFYVRGRGDVQARRLMYEQWKGEELDPESHIHRNKAVCAEQMCVNPQHFSIHNRQKEVIVSRHAGERDCFQCGKRFHSPNKQTIHGCERCSQRIREELPPAED